MRRINRTNPPQTHLLHRLGLAFALFVGCFAFVTVWNGPAHVMNNNSVVDVVEPTESAEATHAATPNGHSKQVQLQPVPVVMEEPIDLEVRYSVGDVAEEASLRTPVNERLLAPKSTKPPPVTTKAPKSTKAPALSNTTKSPKSTKAPAGSNTTKAPKSTKAPAGSNTTKAPKSSKSSKATSSPTISLG